jgi:hypothetical protein
MTQEETAAYQLLSYYIKMRRTIFPDYRHGRTIKNVKNIRKSILFKHMLKFLKENNHRFDLFHSTLFIRAQLEIMKKIQNDGNKPLVEVNMLHGPQADRRWELWKKWVKERNNVSQINYVFVESNIVCDFEKTKKEICNMLNNEIDFNNYAAHASTILKLAILKKISPIYVICSEWVKQLPEQIKNDLNDLCNLDNFKDFNLENAINLYKKYFGYEINKS